eukprot:4899194-Amphidinium_carterae.1
MFQCVRNAAVFARVTWHLLVRVASSCAVPCANHRLKRQDPGMCIIFASSFACACRCLVLLLLALCPPSSVFACCFPEDVVSRVTALAMCTVLDLAVALIDTLRRLGSPC